MFESWRLAENGGTTYAVGRIGPTSSLQAAEFKESMMGRWAIPVAAAIAIFVCGPASSAQDLISKKYVLDREHSDDVYDAIDSAVPTPSNVNWPDLCKRLFKSNMPTDAFRITSILGRITISDDSVRPIIDVWTGGEGMKWKINDGEVLDVSAKQDGESVVLIIRGIDNERTTVYRNVGQQLVGESTIVSPGIVTPIRYKLVYN